MRGTLGKIAASPCRSSVQANDDRLVENPGPVGQALSDHAVQWLCPGNFINLLLVNGKFISVKSTIRNPIERLTLNEDSCLLLLFWEISFHVTCTLSKYSKIKYQASSTPHEYMLSPRVNRLNASVY